LKVPLGESEASPILSSSPGPSPGKSLSQPQKRVLFADEQYVFDILSPVRMLSHTPARQNEKDTGSSSEKQKMLPDGLLSTPQCTLTPPMRASQPRVLFPSGHTPAKQRDDSAAVRKLHLAIFGCANGASPGEPLVNGHLSRQTYGSEHEAPSLLKLKHLQRMQRVQFEHPTVNVTPQRIPNATPALRDILNTHATAVKFTPKPPPRVLKPQQLSS